MKLNDKRLYQATSLQDFLFRLRYRDGDQIRRQALREIAGLVNVGFVSPDKTKIWGVDISPWDGNVNFAPTVHAGAKFVVIKAIDGTVPSKYWRENNERAIAAGLANSAYAWLYPDRLVSAKAQAKAFYELIKDARLKLPPVVDFEWTRYAGQQANPNYDDLNKWVTEFNRLSGEPVLYSAAGFMNPLGKMPQWLRDKFSGFHFASYGGKEPVYPMGFSSYDVWQFSANGDALVLCPGDTNKKELDLNYMTEAFYRRYVGEVTEPPPVETGATMQATVRSGYTLTVRDATGTDTGKRLTVGDKVYGAITGGRIYFLRIYRAGGTVEEQPGNAATVNPANSAEAYMTLANVTEEPPTVPPTEVKPTEITVKMSNGTTWKATDFQKVG